jgi:hypothetical protein
VLLGLLGYAVAMPAVTINGVTFDAHTLLFASLAILLGYQSVLFAIFTKTFAISEGLLPRDQRLEGFYRLLNLERGLLIGGGTLISGLILLLASVGIWVQRDFGRLNYAETMRWVIPGVTLTAFGFQTILASFFLNILQMKRR